MAPSERRYSWWAGLAVVNTVYPRLVGELHGVGPTELEPPQTRMADDWLEGALAVGKRDTEDLEEGDTRCHDADRDDGAFFGAHVVWQLGVVIAFAIV